MIIPRIVCTARALTTRVATSVSAHLTTHLTRRGQAVLVGKQKTTIKTIYVNPEHFYLYSCTRSHLNISASILLRLILVMDFAFHISYTEYFKPVHGFISCFLECLYHKKLPYIFQIYGEVCVIWTFLDKSTVECVLTSYPVVSPGQHAAVLWAGGGERYRECVTNVQQMDLVSNL